MTKKKALIVIGGVVLASLAGPSRPAHAGEDMWFGGGPMRNLYVDIIFWGDFCPDGYMCPAAQDVLDYVNELTQFMRGNFNPPGLEPALHYYGVSEIYPGEYVVGPQSLGNLGPPGTDQPGVDQVQAVVAAAQDGSYGGAYEVANSSNWVGQSLPTGSNRIAFVVTKGSNEFTFYGTNAIGFHGNNNQTIWGFGMSEDLDVLSHEIFEAMSDPYSNSPYHPNGWAGDLTTAYGYAEVADQCQDYYTDSGGNFIEGNGSGQQSSLIWSATSGDPISGVTAITVNPPFENAYTAPYGGTCEVFIPEQHAPMAATFEYGGNGTQPLAFFYVDVNGAVQELSWSDAGQPVSGGPVSLGPPSSTVKAVGKPAVVYSLEGVGERIFVKGSDGGLWMHYQPNGGLGTWLSLGGQMYGDPAPVLVDNGQWINVFVVGTDDNLYFYELTGSTLYGWSSVPNGSGFLGSPKVVSRDGANTFDVFAPTENGTLEWIAYNVATGWAAPVEIPDLGGQDVVTPVVTAQSTTQMQVFENSTYGMFETMWNGSSWYYATDTEFTVDRVDQNYGLQGGLAVTSWGTGHLDAFGIARTGNLYWWWTNNPIYPNGWTCSRPSDCSLSPSLVGNTNGVTPLISGAPLASGDPLAVSRSPGESEVFYRALADGSLVHLTYSDGAWLTPELVPISMQ